MRAEDVKEKYEYELLKIPGVVGVTVQDNEIVVLVESEDVSLPKSIEGVPLRKIVVGRITMRGGIT